MAVDFCFGLRHAHEDRITTFSGDKNSIIAEFSLRRRLWERDWLTTHTKKMFSEAYFSFAFQHEYCEEAVLQFQVETKIELTLSWYNPYFLMLNMHTT